MYIYQITLLLNRAARVRDLDCGLHAGNRDPLCSCSHDRDTDDLDTSRLIVMNLLP